MLSIVLILLSTPLSICKLGPTSAIPPWAIRSSFFSISRTADELSIVCPTENVPQGTTQEKGWIAYKVQGTLDFSLTGILFSIAKPLADEKISLFAISTYNTDYILVKETQKEKSNQALQKAGFTVQMP